LGIFIRLKLHGSRVNVRRVLEDGLGSWRTMVPRPPGPLLLPLRPSRGNTPLTGHLASSSRSNNNPDTTLGVRMAFNPPNSLSTFHSTITSHYLLTKQLTSRPLWLP
jgi:hypothetical protein